MNPPSSPDEARRADERLRLIVEFSPNALLMVDREGRISLVNAQTEKLFGYAREELLGQPVELLVPERFRAEHPGHRAGFFANPHSRAMGAGRDLFGLRKNGSEVPIEIGLNPLVTNGGTFVLASIIDITERKRTETQLREAHDLLEARVRERTAELATINESLRNEILQRQQADAVMQGDQELLGQIATGRPLPEILETLARKLEAQTSGALCSILVLDADGVHLRHGAAPSLPEAYNRAIDGVAIGPGVGSCGTAAFLRRQVIVADIATDPLWANFKDLALGHGLRACWSTPIQSAAGSVLGTFAMYYRQPRSPTPKDFVTIDRATYLAGIAVERKSAEGALSDSDQRMRLATEATGVGIWEWNVLTNQIRWDVQMFRIYGMAPTPDGFTQYDDWRRCVLPEDLSRQEEILQDTVRRLGRSTREFRIRRQDNGEGRIIQAVETVRTNAQGRAEWVVGTNLDITERRQAEVALQKAHDELESKVLVRTAQLSAKNDELKGFAYTVSHDLKAPLRGITGYAQELERRHKEGLAERAQFCLTQIITASKNLDCLIEDLLKYSRLDAETPTLNEVKLPAMVQNILRDRTHTLTELGVEVEVDLPPVTLRTWDRGLQQVLTNLIDNAVKYSRQSKPPRLTVTAEERPASIHQPSTIILTVADNGIGFDMKYHDRIFGLFNRLVRANEFEGTGAGLAIVKKLVEKLGGTIRAESAPGQGATFYVILPSTINH